MSASWLACWKKGARVVTGALRNEACIKLSAHEQDAVVVPGETPTSDARLHAVGLTCGTLEPLIAAKLRVLEPGQVLEITADRPEAAEGIRSWLRLTGNTLVRVEVETESGHARYFVEKKIP